MGWGFRVSSRHGTIIAAALTLGAGRGWSAPAPEFAARERKVADLKVFLADREKELASLVGLHETKVRDAEALGRQVDGLKARAGRSLLENQRLEKLLARGRTQLEDIERSESRQREVREEAFAAASAIVLELEDFLQHDLAGLRDAQEPAARQALLDRVIGLDRDRRAYQDRMNALAPAIPPPAEIPAGVTWTPEMLEDQRRSYEAAITRLEEERSRLSRELQTRESLSAAVAKPGTRDAASVRLKAEIADRERKIKSYREKNARLGRVPAGAR